MVHAEVLAQVARRGGQGSVDPLHFAQDPAFVHGEHCLVVPDLLKNCSAGKFVTRLLEIIPVISLFAELLLEVAQGQALSLQHPPVWNFFSTEKVGDNQLTGLERVDTCQFLWLFVIFWSQAWVGEG